MYTPTGRKGAFLLVAILLLISILLEQWLARLCPLLSETGGVRPMIVFLDIPLRTPVDIDWIPVGFIFIFFYSIVTTARIDATAKKAFRKKSWAVLGRWWLLLVCLLGSGALYSWASDYLPKQIRNGIDSFGVRADLILPYPSGDTIHLKGSMIMLVFFIIGWRLLVNKAALDPLQAPLANTPPANTPAADIHPAKASPERGRIAMRIPEPVEVKGPGARPCTAVAMPEPSGRKKAIRPCIVEGDIKPAVVATFS